MLLLGLTVSIPIKRLVINTGELKFPTVVPAVETLKGLYSKGNEAMIKASSLGIAGVVGIITKTLVEKSIIPPMLTLTKAKVAGIGFGKLTLFFEASWIFIGFGTFIGPRVGITMLVGMLLNFCVLAPWMIQKKRSSTPHLKYGAKRWSIFR
ncbi:OPT/YSL family transporter [bacterium]|nr:OPT/YSL family transporter [bacterium]